MRSWACAVRPATAHWRVIIHRVRYPCGAARQDLETLLASRAPSPPLPACGGKCLPARNPPFHERQLDASGRPPSSSPRYREDRSHGLFRHRVRWFDPGPTNLAARSGVAFRAGSSNSGRGVTGGFHRRARDVRAAVIVVPAHRSSSAPLRSGARPGLLNTCDLLLPATTVRTGLRSPPAGMESVTSPCVAQVGGDLRASPGRVHAFSRLSRWMSTPASLQRSAPVPELASRRCCWYRHAPPRAALSRPRSRAGRCASRGSV